MRVQRPAEAEAGNALQKVEKLRLTNGSAASSGAAIQKKGLDPPARH